MDVINVAVARKTVTIAISLALVVSAQVCSAWARGSGGGRSSSGMGRSNGQSTTRNFAYSTSTNFTQSTKGVNHFPNVTKVSTTFTKVGNSKSGFVGNKFQFQKLAKTSKGPFWKKYGGWGKYCGPWGCNFGWGWGCWDSPWCYGWCWYEPIPVVAYYNPYCDCAGTVVDGIDYSVPITSSTSAADGDVSNILATAREAFAQGDLDAASKAISVAILQAPQNQDVHQFHSLVLFAKREYCKSATVAHVVLEAGPGWTWNTLQTFYASPDAYTAQLRQLEHYVGEHPTDANVRFLLGYHYLMLDHAEVAQRQFAQTIDLEPKDKLASNILSGLKSEATAKQTPAPTASVQAVANAVVANKPVGDKPQSTIVEPDEDADDAADTADDTTAVKTAPARQVSATEVSSPMSGSWKANPAKGIQIELTLRNDKTFTWKFTANGKAQNFSGKYELSETSLVLTREDGESMDGALERNANGFKFRMKDAEAKDPGLTFSR
jgi:hypothetical protein